MERTDWIHEKTIPSAPLPIARPETIMMARHAIRSMDADIDSKSMKYTRAHERHHARRQAIEAALVQSIAKYGMPGEDAQ
jgi:hypothetical protein